MKQQTFILSVWCGAESYKNAEERKRDFFRFSCKKVETVKKYLRGYVLQAKEKRLDFLYPFFFAKDGQFEIENTPDGFNPEKVVLSGFISEL